MSQDFGAKVSLPGTDVNTAGDSQLYLNSSWPVLKIDDDLSGTTTLRVGQTFTINHNLGYPPFTMLFSTATGFRGPIDSVNSSTATFSNVINDSYRYYIFRNPLNINFQAPNIQLAQTQFGTNNQDFGIKFVKPGKDIESTDLRDFTIHSGTKSLQVHQVIYQPLGTVVGDTYNGIHGLKYLTDLPYNPVYFVFYSADNVNFVPVFATNQQAPVVNFDAIDGGIVLNANNKSNDWGVFFILLDPFQSLTQINVTL